MPIRQDDVLALARAAQRHAEGLNDLIVTVQRAAKRQAEDHSYTAEDALNTIMAMIPAVIAPPAATSLITATLQWYQKNHKRNEYNAHRMARIRAGQSAAELRNVRERILGKRAEGQAGPFSTLKRPKSQPQAVEVEVEDGQAGPGYETAQQKATPDNLDAAPFVPFDKRPAPAPMTTAEHEAMLAQLRQDKLDEAKIMADFGKPPAEAGPYNGPNGDRPGGSDSV